MSNDNGHPPLPIPCRKAGRPTRAAGPKIDLAQAYRLRVVNRLSFKEIAHVLGVAKSTVHDALQRLHRVLPDPEQIRAYEEVEPYLLTTVKARLLDSLADETAIEKASLNNRGFAFTQVSNQERLTKGQATSHTSLMALIASADDVLYPKQRKRNAAESEKGNGKQLEGTVNSKGAS